MVSLLFSSNSVLVYVPALSSPEIGETPHRKGQRGGFRKIGVPTETSGPSTGLRLRVLSSASNVSLYTSTLYFSPFFLLFLFSLSRRISRIMYRIEYATETDGPGLAKINVESFQGRRSLGECFPEASQTRLQEYKAVVAMKHLANPNMHVLKIHDPASGELVAYTRWRLPSSFDLSVVPLTEQAALYAKDPVPYAPRPMNEDVFHAFKKLLEESRRRYTTEDDMRKWAPGVCPSGPFAISRALTHNYPQSSIS